MLGSSDVGRRGGSRKAIQNVREKRNWKGICNDFYINLSLCVDIHTKNKLNTLKKWSEKWENSSDSNSHVYQKLKYASDIWLDYIIYEGAFKLEFDTCLN